MDINVVPSWRRFVSYAALLLFLAALIGLLATNYLAGLVFLGSIAAAWLFYLFAASIIDRFKRSGVFGRVVIVILLLAFGCGLPLALLAFLNLYSGQYYFTSSTSISIYQYHVQVGMVDNVTLELREQIVTGSGDEPVDLPPRVVTSRPAGFLLNEVTIAPLGMDANGSFSVRLPDGGELEGMFCESGLCPTVDVELLDFPRDSFYAAKMAANLERFPYLDKETVRWTVVDPRKGITLAYIRPPFNRFLFLLKPFIGASTFGEWSVAALGFFVSSVVIPIVKPVFTNLAQERIKNLWKGFPRKKKAKK